MDDGALADLRVVDWASGLGGAFAAKAFADLGADVVKVEPPEGDAARQHGPFPGDVPHPEKSGQFLYLNANKRGVTLGLDGARGREALRRLLGWADVLITDAPARRLEELALDYPSIAALNPRLIVTVISPFGLTGPYCDYQGSDLIAWHMGGTGAGTPFNAVTKPVEQPPLRGGGYQAEYLAGWTAASATMIAVFYRDTYGRGQLVDVSMMEAVANMVRPQLAMVSYDPNAVRNSRLKAGPPWIYPCKDGFISASHGRDHWWEALKELMGRPEWAEAEDFATIASRRTNADALDVLLGEWFSNYTREELYRKLVERGVPCFPVQTPAEVVASPHYRAREAIVEQQHPAAGTVAQPGPFVRLSRTPWRLRRPAPLLGEHNEDVLCGLLGFGTDELPELAGLAPPAAV